MKKGIFLFLTILGLSNVFANGVGVNSYRYNDAVTFVEKGVEFHVFLNGDFDFYRLNNYYNRNNRPFVARDYYGRVTRVGNAFINYGFNNNVIAIGNVPIRYRFGELRSVGNLFVDYDRWGYPHFRGFVRNNRFYNDGFRFNINLGTVCVYDDPFFYGRDFRNNYRRFREDANFFYYRAVPNARLGNRSQIIKRRKPNNTARINSNNRYLKNNRNSRNINRSNTRDINRNENFRNLNDNKRKDINKSNSRNINRNSNTRNSNTNRDYKSYKKNDSKSVRSYSNTRSADRKSSTKNNKDYNTNSRRSR